MAFSTGMALTPKAEDPVCGVMGSRGLLEDIHILISEPVNVSSYVAEGTLQM